MTTNTSKGKEDFFFFLNPPLVICWRQQGWKLASSAYLGHVETEHLSKAPIQTVAS